MKARGEQATDLYRGGVFWDGEVLHCVAISPTGGGTGGTVETNIPKANSGRQAPWNFRGKVQGQLLTGDSCMLFSLP